MTFDRRRLPWLSLLHALRLSSVLLGVLLFAPSLGAEVPWRGRPFQITANEKPMADFLRELLATQGISAVIDPKVTGSISGRFSGAARQVLDSVCANYGFSWYYDGSFMYIDMASDARSEMVPIAPGSGPRIRAALAEARITDSRFPITINEAQGTALVSGPRRYVELAKQAIRIGGQREAGTDRAEVRMFPLKYAWAADVRAQRGGRDVTVPGVASVLQSLYGGGSASVGGAGGRAPTSAFRMGPERQIRLRSGESINAPKIEIATGTADDDGLAQASVSRGGLPQFFPDTRMNAVLVRDLPERMAQYTRLIASMDTRPQLVEIEVTIMDISTNTLDSIGVDWRLHTRRVDFQTGNGTNPPLSWANAATTAGQTGAFTPLGGVLTASIGNELRNFLLARVNLLAQNGDASFIARPKVLTLNNTEAVLENLSELHVRVDGFQDAGLFNITAGTSLRVTPLLIEEREGRGVMMSINIEDGDLSPMMVDSIPIVRRRTVTTQAMVDEGTSLLIAGFSTEEKVNAVTKVPWLGDLPIAGGLFRSSEKTRNNMERFYLLTPRLVIPASALATQAAPVQQAPVQQAPVTQ